MLNLLWNESEVKAEGVNCHKFVNILAQKICLHVRRAHSEDNRQAVQQLQEL